MSYLLVLKTSRNVYYSAEWMFITILFAVAVGLFVYYGVKKGFFSDFDVSKREERGALFVFTAVLCLIYFTVVFLLNGPKVLFVALGALLLGLMIADLINKKVKASIHLSVFSSFCVILGILYGGAFWLILLFAPLVAWSRIKLKRHMPLETFLGGLLGIVLVALVYFVVIYFRP